ncbi:MAG: acylneuraminate cytidylyltransferase family protein [Gammaproteobacteria bacterium]|nr:acylneuraminate cytidylyltransferase family protein [Gammaproteobacteria bacterium]
MKAHSERVPGKNFRTLAGKPLFRWMLDRLLLLGEVDQVVINTDARPQLEATGPGRDPRVLIRDRARDLCGDLVNMNRIIEDDMGSVSADVYLMTHTTNPLLGIGTLRAAIGEFMRGRSSGECDSLFSVTRYQTRFYRADGSAVNHDPDALVRTQDLEPWFEENSNLYLFTPQSFAARRSRIGRRPRLFETPQLESVDIDTLEDWQLAEALLRAGAAEGSR